jgi:hypothetical protein
LKKKIFSVLFALGLVLSLSLIPAVPAMAGSPELPVNLGSAGDFVILAKSGISTTGTTSIVGDIGVSPIAATAITGFGLILDASGQFSTSDPSSLVTGKVYAADYAVPTPAYMTTAVSDMQAAYTDAAGRTSPTATELGAGNIGGLTLAPGLYKWSSGVIIPTDVTLSGGPDDVWIFQIAGTLDISSAKSVILSGGAQAKNIFWTVAGAVTLGTTSEFNGNILAKTNIAMNTGATLNGRALAQTAVTLIANTITVPAPSGVAPAQAPVDLGSAGNFAVLAGSTVTNTGATVVTGDLGVSPGTAVTGFLPGIVNGTQYTGVDSAAVQAQEDLTAAYNDAAGQSTGPVTVAGNLGGQTLYPGLYKSTSSLEISSGDLTLDAQGDANAVFIFQMGSTLTTTTGRQVILTNGAKASNVYWQVGSSATLGTYSVFKGNILALASITLNTGATLDGRALAQTGAVTLDTNTITVPTP